MVILLLIIGICPNCRNHGSMLGMFQYGIRLIPFIIEFGITTDGEVKLRAGLPGKVAIDL